MSRSIHHCLGLLSLVGVSALASTAAAEDIAAAEALFNHGLAQMEARNFKVGCAELAESQRLDPRPGTLYTLAQCEVRWGRTATAVTRLGDYLQLYERLPAEQKARQRERPKVAKEQHDKLALLVPELTLSLPPGAPAGTVVKRDAAVVAGAALGMALPVDPGEHVVSTQAPGGPLWEQTITLVEGEKKPLVLEVKGAPLVDARPPPPPVTTPTPPTPEPPADQPGTSGRRVAVYAIGGVGVAALALGGVMGGLALGKKSTIKAHCGSAIGQADPLTCDTDGLAAASSVKTVGLVSTIGFAAGAAGIGTTLVLLLTEQKTAKPRADARRPWISASVLSVGAKATVVGVHGQW
jgi:hypothetical protein